VFSIFQKIYENSFFRPLLFLTVTTVGILEGNLEGRRQSAASLSCHKQMLQNVRIGSLEQG